jgi:hypothetical protein
MVPNEDVLILDEALDNISDAVQKLRAAQRDLAVVGGYGREPENYQEGLVHRVRTALAITEAAYIVK